MLTCLWNDSILWNPSQLIFKKSHFSNGLYLIAKLHRSSLEKGNIVHFYIVHSSTTGDSYSKRWWKTIIQIIKKTAHYKGWLFPVLQGKTIPGLPTAEKCPRLAIQIITDLPRDIDKRLLYGNIRASELTFDRLW